MKIHEKTDYLLEQLRLCLVTKDVIRSGMTAGKINAKILEEADMQVCACLDLCS